MSETIWTCDKCGSIMPTDSIAAHAAWHKKRDAEDIEATRYPPPRDNNAIIKGYIERIAYLEELNRRLEKYAAFDADGYIAHEGQAFISVECKNCGRTFPQSRAAYEVLQRQTHERNGRVDL